MYNIILTTYLSAAYDTIDHMTLLKRFEHYGVQGLPLKLFESYLEDRNKFGLNCYLP